MGRYLGAYTPSGGETYPPFINFTELGGGKVRIILRSPSILQKLLKDDETLYPNTGPIAQMDIDADELKKLLTEVLGKMYDE